MGFRNVVLNGPVQVKTEIQLGDSQEKCPIQNFTLFTSYVSVIINLNEIFRYFIFLQPRNIQIRVVILKLAF